MQYTQFNDSYKLKLAYVGQYTFTFSCERRERYGLDANWLNEAAYLQFEDYYPLAVECTHATFSYVKLPCATNMSAQSLALLPAEYCWRVANGRAYPAVISWTESCPFAAWLARDRKRFSILKKLFRESIQVGPSANFRGNVL